MFDGEKMNDKMIFQEYDEIIKRAQGQPGIAELMQVYDQYDLLLRQSHEYLSSTRPKTVIATTNSSSV